MIKLFSAIYSLNDNSDILKVFTNSTALSNAVTTNAERHPQGYLLNSLLLDHLYQQKIIQLLKEDSEKELFAIDYTINLIESRPFTTFLYREAIINE